MAFLKNLFKSSYTRQELEIFGFLSEIDLFQNLTAKEKSYFLPYLHERIYRKDEVVFFRGDPSHALYIVKSGAIELSIDVNNDVERLTQVKRGSVLGESCLIKNTRRQFHAITISEAATLYVVPQDSIFFVFENHIQVRVKMLEQLAETYNKYNSQLIKSYQASLGFFNLTQVFSRLEKK